MAQAIGVYSKLLLCPEKSLNVLPASLTGKVLALPFNSVSLAASQNTTDPGTISGRRDSVEAIYGNIDVSGTISVPADSNALGWWLAFAFGSPTTSSAGSGKYKHIFKAANTQPSASIEKVFNNGVILKESGCKVSKLGFSFGGDGELVVNIDIVGCNETIEEAEWSGANKIPMRRYNNFQSSLLIDNEVQQIATEVTCDIDFGIDTEGYAIGGNGYRARANEGIIKPTGSITVFFDDASYLRKAESSTEMGIEVDLTHGDNVLKLIMPEVKFARTSPSIDGPTGITQQMDYSAYYGDNDKDACVLFELTNDVASYEFEG